MNNSRLNSATTTVNSISIPSFHRISPTLDSPKSKTNLPVYNSPSRVDDKTSTNNLRFYDNISPKRSKVHFRNGYSSWGSLCTNSTSSSAKTTDNRRHTIGSSPKLSGERKKQTAMPIVIGRAKYEFPTDHFHKKECEIGLGAFIKVDVLRSGKPFVSIFV